jgi:uncharacterized protein (TIGR02266 family)
MNETRRDHRAPIALKIRYKSASVDEFVEHYAADISRGGVFIKSKTPLDVGTLLKFELQLKDETELVAGVGRVVWIRKLEDAFEDHPAGMGIKFVKMDGQSRSFVEELVAKRGPSIGRFDEGSADVTPEKGLKIPPGEPAPVAPEDRSDLRNTSELLASAIAEAGVGGETASEALEQGEKAFRKSQEVTGKFSQSAATGSSGGAAITQGEAQKKGAALPLVATIVVLTLAGGAYLVFGRGGAEPQADVDGRPAPIEARPAAHVAEPEPAEPEVDEPEAAEPSPEEAAPEPARGAYRVIVTTDPSGAKVKIGDQEATSPAEVTFDEQPSTMDVGAMLPGYRPSYIRLRPSAYREVDGSFEARVTLTLKPKSSGAPEGDEQSDSAPAEPKPASKPEPEATDD